MKFGSNVGAYKHAGNGIVMTVKSALALKYGDIVIVDSANDVPASGMLSVKTNAGADAASVIGVICSPGGIDAGGVGDMGVLGMFEVNVATATSNFAVGAALTTSATAGAAADGTETLLNIFGKVLSTPNDATTVLLAWVNII